MTITSLSSLVIFSLVITTKATTDGFAVRLIHRDSPQSPFYDHKMTTFDRIVSAVNRSLSRLNYLNSLTASKSLISDFSNKLVYDHCEYIMIFKVGSPPTTVHAIADTGSEIIWLNCLPCKGCDPYNVPPIFNPSNSSTFTQVICGKGEVCTFDERYGDGPEGDAETKGFYAHDYFIFEGQTQNSAVTVGRLKFGCGEDSSDSQPLEGKQLGIVGLNREEKSLVAQLSITKFSHCMVMPGIKNEETSEGSRMYFGSMAVIAGGQTPFDMTDEVYYSLTLDGISVGNEKVLIPDKFFNEDGFIIHSGARFSYLKSKAFDELIKVLKKATKLPQLMNPINPFKWCFEGSSNDLDNFPPPDITLHFKNADFILDKRSAYINLGGNVWCLAMLPSIDQSTLGNFQQQNYWVGYDLEAGMVSFAPVDCTIF